MHGFNPINNAYSNGSPFKYYISIFWGRSEAEAMLILFFLGEGNNSEKSFSSSRVFFIPYRVLASHPKMKHPADKVCV